jgi:hypothetical protein
MTRVFHANEKWIYLEQKITRKGKDIAICIVRSTIKKGRDTVDIPSVFHLLGHQLPPAEGQALINLYEKENILLRERLCT